MLCLRLTMLNMRALYHRDVSDKADVQLHYQQFKPVFEIGQSIRARETENCPTFAHVGCSKLRNLTESTFGCQPTTLGTSMARIW